MIKVGLCGFTIGVEEYFRHFPLVEVQQTFYDPPRLTTLERWRMIAPPDFEFTMKAWQLITHASTSSTYRRMKSPMTERERGECGSFRPTAAVERGWKTTLVCARTLRATAILFQCPASFRPTDENIANMQHFFATIEVPKGMRLLWEPRGEWPAATVEALCRDLGLVHVVDPFDRPTVIPETVYWRLHGISGSRHVYSDTELQRLEAMLGSPKTAYVMFNNIPRVGDAQRFVARLRQSSLRS